MLTLKEGPPCQAPTSEPGWGLVPSGGCGRQRIHDPLSALTVLSLSLSLWEISKDIAP